MNVVKDSYIWKTRENMKKEECLRKKQLDVYEKLEILSNAKQNISSS